VFHVCDLGGNAIIIWVCDKDDSLKYLKIY
jgi:hypothetical protein